MSEQLHVVKGESWSAGGPRKRPSLVLAHQSRNPREREGVMWMLLPPKRYSLLMTQRITKGKPLKDKGVRRQSLCVHGIYECVGVGKRLLVILYFAAHRHLRLERAVSVSTINL